MDYQKIKDLLDNTPNQISKFKTKKWVEMIDDELGIVKLNLKLQC